MQRTAETPEASNHEPTVSGLPGDIPRLFVPQGRFLIVFFKERHTREVADALGDADAVLTALAPYCEAVLVVLTGQGQFAPVARGGPHRHMGQSDTPGITQLDPQAKAPRGVLPRCVGVLTNSRKRETLQGHSH